MKLALLLEEMAHDKKCRHKHRYIGGYGGTLYSPFESEQKQRQNHVGSAPIRFVYMAFPGYPVARITLL